jgi:hypothetical protein
MPNSKKGLFGQRLSFFAFSERAQDETKRSSSMVEVALHGAALLRLEPTHPFVKKLFPVCSVRVRFQV